MTNDATNPINPRPGPAGKGSRPPRDCQVCYGPHDDEIHMATESIHQWLKDTILDHLGAYDSEVAA